ncbi:fasciclin domain-containing protein [Aetokthonos hydrillicola Thurmond2011]|uniref:Fasciclin domain-containing protein n=1 Tax=Aetokthonos hydrillicola Thurmond2011 TaxID=2712845 RepID=A0AAP5IDI0_9CYAN|nr:fasciclin domain-containing protein [Aetokthonos hydrillicola]MBO3461587.1 hypothetical protein [Aetokthonos hydrillicola CCALA 1050]MBW4586111.1 fasciclin domain-containing protein [Aetokthonos hydrillicola CCALA 1050]MDR9897718.1 fasciclin domain-containing protein [Aetokthonos hydrillicola Thurmond2011]
MRNLFSLTTLNSKLLVFGLTAVVSSITVSAIASAQVTNPSPTSTSNVTSKSTFSDIGSTYWGRPFIQALAKRNIITGFNDGTFRPNQPVSRAEFAAMIQKAFNKKSVRQSSPAEFKDVRPNYWASSAIREAYETGFMSGYPGNLFLPNQTISKVDAIIALVNGLSLSSNGNTSNNLSTHYKDASLIPDYAVNAVAAATNDNLVVNYPNVKRFNPWMPVTRVEAAALLYQALVTQGRVQPLASNVAATQFIVGRKYVAGGTNKVNQTASASFSNASDDIFSRAASSRSFTTLTSLLKTAGLADTLRESGSYTVFAPTNQAFAALPQDTLRRLQQPANRQTLIKILKYHVVPEKLTATKLSDGQITTMEGQPINVQVGSANDQIDVNNARVILPNIQASNGVIHAVDKVLLPPNFDLSQRLQ